jgi:hypothetical protein
MVAVKFLILMLILICTSGCVTQNFPQPALSKDQKIVGVGYAVINSQPGDSSEEKRLMAIKASKIEAYKSLAEQIYGQYVEARGLLSNSRVSEEQIASRVEGIIYSARLVSIKPISDNSYQTILEVGKGDLLSESKEPQNNDHDSKKNPFYGTLGMAGQRR